MVELRTKRGFAIRVRCGICNIPLVLIGEEEKKCVLKCHGCNKEHTFYFKQEEAPPSGAAWAKGNFGMA